MTRGRAARKLVGLITRRSQVQILSPLLCLDSSVGRELTFGRLEGDGSNPSLAQLFK